jgi:hypothetical protein
MVRVSFLHAMRAKNALHNACYYWLFRKKDLADIPEQKELSKQASIVA